MNEYAGHCKELLDTLNSDGQLFGSQELWTDHEVIGDVIHISGFLEMQNGKIGRGLGNNISQLNLRFSAESYYHDIPKG